MVLRMTNTDNLTPEEFSKLPFAEKLRIAAADTDAYIRAEKEASNIRFHLEPGREHDA
jgi:hypothetical protein